MSRIPKKIYQAWHDKNVKQIFKKYIEKTLELNPEYEYELFGEEDMDNFIKENYDEEIYGCYKRIKLITAKVDFWRYLILYKNGGIYIDIDSALLKNIDDLILNYDAVITREPNPPNEYVQWALFFCKEHPILKQTIENVVYNIKNNRYSDHVGKMTGPLPYTEAIDKLNQSVGFILNRHDNSLFEHNPELSARPDEIINYGHFNCRLYGIQYGNFALSWVPEKDEMYSPQNPHWTTQSIEGVLY
jgi:mannosyltransferase OCH1-like enzyme